MEVVILIICFVALYAINSRYVGPIVLNIVGFPGALIGLKSERKTEARYIIGAIISSIGQVYIYIAFMIYIINWTRIKVEGGGFSKYIIWTFCLISTVGAIQRIHQQAKKEFIESKSQFENPQITGLLVTEIVAFFGFFIIIFFPSLFEPLWGWIRNIPYPF